MDKEDKIAYAIHAGSAVIAISIIFSANLGIVATTMGITFVVGYTFWNARFNS